MLQINEQARDEIIMYIKTSTPRETSVGGALNLIAFLAQLKSIKLTEGKTPCQENTKKTLPELKKQ